MKNEIKEMDSDLQLLQHKRIHQATVLSISSRSKKKQEESTQPEVNKATMSEEVGFTL